MATGIAPPTNASPSTGSGHRANVDHLGQDELRRLRDAGSIVVNGERRRPRYFDGRFLAAQDLTREQDYFVARQADLARAAGSGVIHGLSVHAPGAQRVRIGAGSGVTPAGELVVLLKELEVNFEEIEQAQQLDAAFGLQTLPNDPSRRRTGLFVLALRPVEYTANPIAAYPASITERRGFADGEIIEAVAVTLVRYGDDHGEVDAQRLRARVARQIFVERMPGGVPAEALPIAMLQFELGQVRWVDVHMVRRELGAEHVGAPGFGLSPRGLREAYVLQHRAHLEAVVGERSARKVGSRFAAADVFRSLPPAGQLPVDAIGRRDVLRYTQVYFPPQMPVEMALVPHDELAVLVEEALLLPAIDLMAPAEDLDFTQITLLLPVPRTALQSQRRRLAIRLEPAAPGMLLRRDPLEVFQRLLARRLPAGPLAGTPSAEEIELDERWSGALRLAAEAGGYVWYVRRRTLQWRSVPADPASSGAALPFRVDEAQPIELQSQGRVPFPPRPRPPIPLEPGPVTPRPPIDPGPLTDPLPPRPVDTRPPAPLPADPGTPVDRGLRDTAPVEPSSASARKSRPPTARGQKPQPSRAPRSKPPASRRKKDD